MPVIKTMPALEVIRGFKGTLDFYLWKGLPCVRKWPHTPRAHLTQGTLDANAIFVAIIQAYGLLGGTVKALFKEAAADQPRTGRDLFVTATYGHLHESSMSEITDLITEANVLLTTLIELTHALKSNDADRLIVRAEDQLFSINSDLKSNRQVVISGAGGFTDSEIVPAGEIWCVHNLGSIDTNNATTSHMYVILSGGTEYALYEDYAAHAAGIRAYQQRTFWLYPGDCIRVWWRGALAGDSCRIDLFGYIQSLEI